MMFFEPLKYCRRRLLPVGLVLIVLISMEARAGSDDVCFGKPLDIEGLTFDRKINGFVDKNGLKYRLSNILLAGRGDFFATIDKQTGENIDHLIGEFLRNTTKTQVSAAGDQDRYGRQPVDVFAMRQLEKRWLQQELVRNGMAIVHPEVKEGKCTKRLFVAENEARKMQRGIWRADNTVIMAANDKNWQLRKDRYQLVDGRVLSVGKTRKRVYLNFGTYWQEDFTVVIANKHIKRFNSAIGEFDTLAGKAVRIRGWLVSNRGPQIEVYYPGQIELELE